MPLSQFHLITVLNWVQLSAEIHTWACTEKLFCWNDICCERL